MATLTEKLEQLQTEYDELSQEIDELAERLESILGRKYAVEQILDHFTIEEEADDDL